MQKNNNSPWLYQLKRTRAVDTLLGDMRTDIAIVGAGIAGIMTAYFTLKYTDREVLLVEAGRVAHGATGHNAGQIVFEFEKEFHRLVEDHGLALAADAEKSVRGAWVLIEEIYHDAQLTTPMSSFLGYNGYATVGRVVEELKNNALRVEAGMSVPPVYISEKAEGLDEIPAAYKDLYSIVPHENVLALLETDDTQYVAVMAERKGCVNSAMLVEEIVGYLLATYKGRFVLAEESPVREVVLDQDSGMLKITDHSVYAKKIVMCTNGFEKFKITNMAGGNIDTKFHHMVIGNIGYMAGYLEDMTHPPIALQYHDKEQIEFGHREHSYQEKPYMYLTRRPYELEKNERHNLVCVGGPEQNIEDTTAYKNEGEVVAESVDQIENFIHKTYKHGPKGKVDFEFKWHGLMGYTPTNMRVIGEEPKNGVLMYNLGCNGIGILTSIYGGKRISQMLKGEALGPSLFDPKISY
ncbi:MAG TPA: FAD-binding oxidoreductase [Candidatus Paceibacterota bacterium]